MSGIAVNRNASFGLRQKPSPAEGSRKRETAVPLKENRFLHPFFCVVEHSGKLKNTLMQCVDFAALLTIFIILLVTVFYIIFAKFSLKIDKAIK